MHNSTPQHTQSDSRILTVNGGSSSIKFSIFEASKTLDRTWSGKTDRIGLSERTFEFHDAIKNQRSRQEVDAVDFRTATDFLIQWLDDQIGLSSIDAVGHRASCSH